MKHKWKEYTQSFNIKYDNNDPLPSDRRKKPYPFIRKHKMKLKHNTWSCYYIEWMVLLTKANQERFFHIWETMPTWWGEKGRQNSEKIATVK